MPTYDYRCNNCGHPVTLFYKTYKDYDAATPTCTNCGSTELTRVIRRVAIQKPGRDFSRMSSNEMLSVMDSGNPQEMGRMMQQVTESAGGEAGGDMGADYHEVTERLLNGEKPDKIEQDLGSRTSTASADE
ncbi:MAG: zinc ribbon domain-containing protein [Burkholderiales bacterium]|nr:zinc ribbon domain-containing protein [Anaerolineae bacterium]